MTKHQIKTYTAFGINTEQAALTDQDIIKIFNQLMSNNLNWENIILRTQLLEVRRDYPSKRYLINFLNKVIQPEGLTAISPKYWEKRGFDTNTAQENSARLQRTRRRPVSVNYWMTNGHTLEESQKLVSNEQRKRSVKGYQLRDSHYRKRKSPKSILYWTERGYSEKEARERIEQNAKNLGNRLKGTPFWVPEYRRNTNILYFQALGLSESEAKIALRRRQTTRYTSPEQKTKFATYYTECWWYTKQNLHLIPNINIRSKDYHLDHIFSIYDGFIHEVEPKVIGSLVNLRVIPAKLNLQKQRNSSISKEDLLHEYQRMENRNQTN